jgi:8-oxo-(d)GTP phosphatase
MADLAGTGEVRAAGAVMWRAGKSGEPAIEVALVHRPRYDDWAFPKGKAEPAEHPLLTAVREVIEETGTRPVLGRWLGQTAYEANGRPKRVDYWAATPAPLTLRPGLNGGAGSGAQAGSGSPGGAEPRSEFVPNDEIDKLDWLPVEAAARRLSYERDVDLLRAFASAPMSTRAYIFLRHAAAVDKEAWPGGGLLRPLDETGRADAWALASLLSCFGPARTFSSAAARCVETVLPYAVRTGVPVTAEPAFVVDSAAADAAGTDAAAARLAELLTGRAQMILCGHRENLPALHAQAIRYFGAQPTAELTLGKGSFSVLHVTHDGPGARLVATERHDVAPPP